ncbi:MAG: hypothetical protein WCT04_13970 [Planctomycetota bacterium]
MRPAINTFALALFLAALGFSYAIATHSDLTASAAASATSRGIKPRSVGMPLAFTNPYLAAGSDPGFPNGGNTGIEPEGYDLGDAISNQPVERFLSATGGAFPYTFKTQPNLDVFSGNQSIPILPPVVPTLGSNGRISHAFQTTGPFIQAARFDAVVSDYIGTSVTGTFRINVYPAAPPPLFRFAQDKLPTAKLGCNYYTKLETVGASSTPAFSIVPGSIKSGGTTYAILELLGLSLSGDGTLFGRPVFARPTTNSTTTIQFKVRAGDNSGLATARNGASQDQLYTLSVEDNDQATSEVLATRCTLTAYHTTPVLDSFTYSGVFDPKGMTVNSLAGSQFTLRINGAKMTGTFDENGVIKNQNGLSVTISPTRSTIQIKCFGAELNNAGNLRFLQSSRDKAAAAKTTIVTQVIFSMEFKHYITCDAIAMDLRSKPDVEYLTYTLGSGRGNSMSGGMQILGTHGQDLKFFDGTKGDPGVEGDAWYVRFMAVPRYGIDSKATTAFPVRNPAQGQTQTGSVSATITIGDDDLGPVSAKINSVRCKYKSDVNTAGILELYLDGERFVHSVQTNSIPPADTGIPQAIFSKDPTVLRFGLSVTGFSGGTGRIIAPNNFLWQAR